MTWAFADFSQMPLSETSDWDLFAWPFWTILMVSQAVSWDSKKDVFPFVLLQVFGLSLESLCVLIGSWDHSSGVITNNSSKSVQPGLFPSSPATDLPSGVWQGIEEKAGSGKSHFNYFPSNCRPCESPFLTKVSRKEANIPKTCCSDNDLFENDLLYFKRHSCEFGKLGEILLHTQCAASWLGAWVVPGNARWKQWSCHTKHGAEIP